MAVLQVGDEGAAGLVLCATVQALVVPPGPLVAGLDVHLEGAETRRYFKVNVMNLDSL